MSVMLDILVGGTLSVRIPGGGTTYSGCKAIIYLGRRYYVCKAIHLGGGGDSVRLYT